MRIPSDSPKQSRHTAVRLIATAVLAFVALAATHESLLAVESAFHCDSSHAPSTPAPLHHQDHACALCELAGAPTLPALAAELPLLQVSLEIGYRASHLTPAPRDESCFPHYRRGPPSLPLA